jgi:hypothetical protein
VLTGRNHHSVNMRSICGFATSAPGYSSVCLRTRRRWRSPSSSMATVSYELQSHGLRQSDRALVQVKKSTRPPAS